MKFGAHVELIFEADSEVNAQAVVANMMEELQDNHPDTETGESWLEDWAPVGGNWIHKV